MVIVYMGRESIADPVNRLDDHGVVGIIADEPPRFHNGARDDPLREDNATTPDGRENLLLGDYAIPMKREVHDQIEYLGLDSL
jgi:hypothetical protein